MPRADDPIGLSATLRQLWGSLSPARRRQSILVFLLMLAGALAELAIIGSVMPFIALLAGGTAGQPIATLALLFIAAVVVATALRLQLAWSSEKLVLGVGHELTVEIQRRVLAQPYSFHVERNTAEIVASLGEVQLLVHGVLHHLMRAAAGVIISLVILAALTAIDPVAAMLAFSMLAALYFVISTFAARRLAANSKTLGGAYARRVQMVQESLGGIRDVIIDQSQRAFLADFRALDAQLAHAQASTSFIAAAPRYLIEAAAMIFIAALALLVAGREGGLAAALPVLAALGVGGVRMLPLIQQAYASWTGVAGHRAVVGRVLALLRLPADEEPENDADPLPFTRAIAMRDVRFTYAGRQDPAVDGISLEIPAGARVALVGSTGSGKSTLADLIMGLLQPDAGEIAVDGTALGPGNLRSWQRQVAHVSQSIFLADASVARNIAFSAPDRPVDMDRVRRAARTAQLESWVDGLPQGFDTAVGERGVRMSGGQRQRLGIARALYKQAPLLVLDEATNALDAATERAVLDAVFADENRTIILIAHRESTVHGCDRIVRLENGRVAEG